MIDNQMILDTQDIMLTATNKFGAVLGMLHEEKNVWILLIKREDPAREDKPYMTIRAAMIARMHCAALVPSYFNGHYDLTQEEALTDFTCRRT